MILLGKILVTDPVAGLDPDVGEGRLTRPDPTYEFEIVPNHLGDEGPE